MLEATAIPAEQQPLPLLTKLVAAVVVVNYKVSSNQSDQMARYFFNFRPFTTKNICPIAQNICQTFAKSGHTVCNKQFKSQITSIYQLLEKTTKVKKK